MEFGDYSRQSAQECCSLGRTGCCGRFSLGVEHTNGDGKRKWQKPCTRASKLHNGNLRLEQSSIECKNRPHICTEKICIFTGAYEGVGGAGPAPAALSSLDFEPKIAPKLEWRNHSRD
ncbi:MAG: hypothetical protein KatS3mg039_1626 [Candidatus Kapaibacterium sp.]|nr:MAG: hypothetical protein KatS3mg039_1626 [Candidatus Kapabacteria bacterium]